MSALATEETTGRLRYLPFDGGRFRIAMGLAPLALADWIEIDENLVADLAAKRALLAARRDEVFCTRPESDDAAAELLALLAEHLPRHHPEQFRGDGTRLSNRVTGEDWDVARPALHPLELCARLVQEDFCLLQRTGDAYALVGASVCSPSRWRLADKIGQPLAAIHDPVPGYEEALARPVDRLFAQLKAEKPVWRINWSIADHPAPFQPERIPGAAALTAADAGEHLWLRVERQTLRRLPATGAIVFTIRSYITVLAAALDTGAAAELAAALRDMPAASRRYKHIAPFAAALLAWLDRRAASH